MATQEQIQVSVQVMAARLRVKADQRLKRETPADIKALAATEETRTSLNKSA